MCLCVWQKNAFVCAFVLVCQHEEVVFACLDNSVFINVSLLCECGKEYGVCLKNSSGYDCFIA